MGQWIEDSFAEYLNPPGDIREQAVSRSEMAHFIDTTPAHYMEKKLNPEAAKEHHNVGTLAHAAILEPVKFDNNILLAPASKRRVADWTGMTTKTASKEFPCVFCDLMIVKGNENFVKGDKHCHVHCVENAPTDPWREMLMENDMLFDLPWEELEKERATAWQHTIGDWYLVTESELEHIKGMRKALANYEVWDGHSALEFLATGINEVSGYARLGLTECRIRPDSRHPNGFHGMGSAYGRSDVPRRIIPDLKTAQSATPWYWYRDVRKYGYGYAACMYPDVANTIDNCVGAEDDYIYLWVVVEKTPPYAVVVHEPAPGRVIKWRNAVNDGLEEMARCRRLNEWPAWPQGVHTDDAWKDD